MRITAFIFLGRLYYFPEQQPYTGLDYLKCKSKIRSDDKALQPQSSPLLSMELWKGQQGPVQGSDPRTGSSIAPGRGNLPAGIPNSRSLAHFPAL